MSVRKEKKAKRKLMERPWLLVALGLTLLIHAAVIWNLQKSQPPKDVVQVVKLPAIVQINNEPVSNLPDAPVENPKTDQPEKNQRNPPPKADDPKQENPNTNVNDPSTSGPPQDTSSNNIASVNPSTPAPSSPVDNSSTPKNQTGISENGNTNVNPTPPPAVDRDAVLAKYRSKVLAAINSHKQYPATAKRLGQKGKVKVNFRVASDGTVSGITAESSNGFDALEKASIDAVRAVGLMPPIPPELGQSSLNMVLTVVFSLS
jgi:periplasmic protein TonB